MTNSHGTLRAQGVDFETDRRMSTDERAQARLDILAGLRKRQAARKAYKAPTLEQRSAKMAKAAEKERTVAAAMAAVTSYMSDVASLTAEVALRDQEIDRLHEEIEGLCAVLDEAERDVRHLAGNPPEDLATLVRSFLTARHKKYPGVQRDLAALLDELAIVSGWYPDED